MKFANVDVCVYVGKCLLTSGERNIQKKTLIPLFWHNPVGCFITTIITNIKRTFCTTSKLHDNSNKTEVIVIDCLTDCSALEGLG